MRYVKLGLLTAIGLIVAGFLHYTLPQRDIVRINNTYNRVTHIGGNWMFYAASDVGTNAQGGESRDIFFIEGVKANNKPIVYRNEDTGWVWPPYFKYDSSNLQAEAADARSNAAAPQWVAVTHYGWRIPWFSIYPNAIGIRAVEGPEVSLFPWPAVVTLLTLVVLAGLVWRIAALFARRLGDGIEDAADDTRSWFARLFRK